MAASLAHKKQLRFVITLGTGKFGATDNNQIVLQGFRATAVIDKAGGVQMSAMHAKVYGVSQSDMNSITSFALQAPQRAVTNPLGVVYLPNTVEVFAIDGPAETLVYSGNIVNAWGDYQNAPDAYLHIQAQSAFYAQLKPVSPRSFKGAVDVATVMEQIAGSMGWKFEGNGVSVKLTDVYLAGTDLDQAKELANMAGIALYPDDGTLAITQSPRTPREMGGLIPLISKDTGLVGYPTFDGWGVNARTLFNPALTFGGRVKVETEVTGAAGEWLVASIAHRLESEKPGGAWFTSVRLNNTGLAIAR